MYYYHQGEKKGFVIRELQTHELQTGFGKLQIEITNLLENYESTFFDG